MFLSVLSEEEKQLFLNLAYTLAYSDGEFGKEEQALIDAYCEEMKTSFHRPEKPIELKKLLEDLKTEILENNRKAVYFELLGLAVVDGKFSEEEKKVMEAVRENFGLSNEFASKCYDFLQQYLQMQERIVEIIFG